jgi:hypothetical protein
MLDPDIVLRTGAVAAQMTASTWPSSTSSR